MLCRADFEASLGYSRTARIARRGESRFSLIGFLAPLSVTRVSEMTYPFPQGTLSIPEAVKRLVRFKNYEWTSQEAWRAICEGILKGIIPAYVLNGGQSHEADRAQFAALGDQEPMMLSFRHFASTTLESPHAFFFPRNAIISGMIGISPLAVTQCRPVYGLLFFLESDFDAAWWKSMEPRNLVEAAAKWLREKYGAHRPALRVDEILRVVKKDGSLGDVRKRTLEAAIALAWQ